ncbi:response regulator [Granulosicoccus sp.]|nr:response regulator [Granulosicoccus sp.]
MININMPRMSGFEVVEKIREDDYFNDVPVVTMFTSSTDENDRKCAIDVGINS